MHKLLSSVFRVQKWGLTHYWIKLPLIKSVFLCVLKRVRTVYVMVESPVANMYDLTNVLIQTVVLLHSPVLWVRRPDARYGKSIARNNIWDVYRHFLLANRLPSPDDVYLMFKLPRKPKGCEIRGLHRGVDDFQLSWNMTLYQLVNLGRLKPWRWKQEAPLKCQILLPVHTAYQISVIAPVILTFFRSCFP